jgi:hypothetical protein
MWFTGEGSADKRMRSITLIRNVLLVVAVVCLGGAYGLAGEWLIAPALLACAGFGFLTPRRSILWRSSCLLLGFVALAAVGVLIGLSVVLVLVGTTAALGAWDLANFAETLRMALNSEMARALQQAHLRALFISLAGGILLSVLAATVRLSLPFAGVVAAALIVVASIAGAVRELGKAA